MRTVRPWTPWVPMALLVALAAPLAADTCDALADALLSGDEKRVESTTQAASEDKSFPVGKAIVKAGEFSGQVAAADKQKQETLIKAVKVMLSVAADHIGEKEMAAAIPKLIEIIDKGDPRTNVIVETALSKATTHGFTDQDYKAQGTKIEAWADHKTMWTKWWKDNAPKPYMQLFMDGMERAGVKLRPATPGPPTDAGTDAMLQTLFGGLNHEQPYIRFAAAKMIRVGIFDRLKLKEPWGFDEDAPQASRAKSIADLRKIYDDHKAEILQMMKPPGK